MLGAALPAAASSSRTFCLSPQGEAEQRLGVIAQQVERELLQHGGSHLGIVQRSAQVRRWVCSWAASAPAGSRWGPAEQQLGVRI